MPADVAEVALPVGFVPERDLVDGQRRELREIEELQLVPRDRQREFKGGFQTIG